MKPLRPNTEYSIVKVSLALESSQDDPKAAIALLEKWLQHNSPFSDWKITVADHTRWSNQKAEPGLLVDEDRDASLSRQARAVVRYKNGTVKTTDRRSLDAARDVGLSAIKATASSENPVVNVVLKKRPNQVPARGKGRVWIDWQTVEIIRPDEIKTK